MGTMELAHVFLSEQPTKELAPYKKLKSQTAVSAEPGDMKSMSYKRAWAVEPSAIRFAGGGNSLAI